MATRATKRKLKDSELRVGEYKLRRGTEDVDEAIRRRELANAYALPQQEFTNRARFVDEKGNSYALPKEDDPIYQRYRDSGTVDAISKSGLPGKKSDVDAGNARGEYLGTALLYARKKRTRKLVAVPRGTVQLVDTETMELYTARVERAIFRRDSKSGHVVFRDLTKFGTLSDPRNFSLRP